VPTLAKALQAHETEIMQLLEKEYSAKLTERLGRTEHDGMEPTGGVPGLTIQPMDMEFMKILYRAYQQADPKTRQTFASVCETILNVPKVS
jgi:hypothetical protein